MNPSRRTSPRRLVPHDRTEHPSLRIKPLQQTCTFPSCRDVARFVVAVAAAQDGGIRAARRCCAEHLEAAVFWAEGLVDADPRARYALINRWGPWALALHEVPA